MNCDHMEPKIYRYLQGELAENERYQVENHLAVCTYCQKSYSQWKELKEGFLFLEVRPPQDFTLRVMESIKSRISGKDFKKYWFAGWFRNIGKGLIAAGILGIFINCSALVANISMEKSFEKTFIMVEEIGNKYMQFYEQVSINDFIHKGKGGVNNEM